MDTWDLINHPRGPVTRSLRRASQTALGTYAAYILHGLRHPALLLPGVTAPERAAPLPGDELVPDPSWVTDFAVDIEAAPGEVWPWLVQIGYGRAGWYTWFPLDNNGLPSADDIIAELQTLAVGDVIPDGPRAAEGYGKWFVRRLDVWPWLLQMGCQRAGWYSWDILDNAGVRSADRIIPELQHLAPGDVLPARPSGAEGFEVLRVEPERALVLRSMSPEWAGTWAFVLEPLGSDRTRLITRYRAAYPPSVRMSIALPVIAKVHAFMASKQLRTIKHHAEHMHGAGASA